MRSRLPLAAIVLAGACQPAPVTSVPVSATPPVAAAAAARLPDPAPVINPPVPGDVPALLATSKKTRCPPHQVAPGLWVRFHCGAFDRVPNTRRANPGKLAML